MINRELISDIKELTNVLKGKAVSANFAEVPKEDVEGLLREKYAALYDPTDVYASPEGKNACFALISENVQAELPKRVEAQFGKYIEQKTVKVGDKPRFIIKLGRKALRKFVTRGAQSGIYRKGTLDKSELEFDYFTLVGGCTVSYREYISGFLTMAELEEIILDQLSYKVMMEVQDMLKGLYATLPAANKHTASSFVETEMDKVIATVGAYGEPVIFCTKKFAATLPLVTENDQKGIADIHTAGHVRDYKGTPVVILEQSFEDEDNLVKVTDDQFAYVLPSGKESLIKVVYEGQLRIKDQELQTGRQAFQFSQTMGMCTLYNNHVGIYKNTSL